MPTKLDEDETIYQIASVFAVQRQLNDEGDYCVIMHTCDVS